MNQLESNSGNNPWKSKNDFNQALYYLKRWVTIVIIILMECLTTEYMYHVLMSYFVDE